MEPKHERHALFKRLGLSDNETFIYEFLLHEPRNPAAVITKRTGLSRSSTYNALTQLENRGLISKDISGPKTLFSPLHPYALSEYLFKTKSQFEKTHQQLLLVMNSLLADFSLAEQTPGVFSFQGSEAMSRVYDEMIRDREEVNTILSRKLLRQFIANYNARYLAQRKKHRIRARVITSETEDVDTPDKSELREVRYLDFKLLPFRMDFKVTKKKVLLATFKEQAPVGIVIIDPVISEHFLAIFNFLWSIAKPAPAR